MTFNDKDPKYQKTVQELWKESYTAEAKERFDDMKERYDQSQVKDPNVALVHGNGGIVSAHSTILLGNEPLS